MSLIASCGIATGCKAPMLTVDDAVVLPGEQVHLAACVEREPILGLSKDVKRVPVTFDVDGRDVGIAKTDREGVATIAEELAPASEQYSVRTVVDGRTLQGTGRVFRWDNDRVIVAVDIDHTIAQTKYKGALQPGGDDLSPPMPGAVEALNVLAQSCHIAYLTCRPRYMIEKTRAWLAEHGFPPGPVITSVRIRDLADPGGFKLRTLRTLRQEWPNLLIGIGDRPADAHAYAANGMLALLAPAKGNLKAKAPAVALHDWDAVSRFFAAHLALLSQPGRVAELVDAHPARSLLARLAAHQQRATP